MTRSIAARAFAALLACTGAVACDAPAEDATAVAAPAATRPVPASTHPTSRELLADAPVGDASDRDRKPPSARVSATRATREAAKPRAAEDHYEYRAGSPDGIGKWYMGREIAHVMGHQAAGWLERGNREDEERPSKMVEILKARLGTDDVFADIGAGTGYYSFRVASLLPKGKVLAVDIQQEMLDLMTQLAKDRKVTNVEPVLGTVTDPSLPDGGVDWVLMVDAYHEFDHPREMMEALFTDLKPGGQVILLEFRAEDPTVFIKECHKMTEAQAIKEMEVVGLKHVETLKDLPWQHVMFFEKPEE
jgi:ubiquinone/menaquinone biosynthesis C-methylase UbiE